MNQDPSPVRSAKEESERRYKLALESSRLFCGQPILDDAMFAKLQKIFSLDEITLGLNSFKDQMEATGGDNIEQKCISLLLSVINKPTPTPTPTPSPLISTQQCVVLFLMLVASLLIAPMIKDMFENTAAFYSPLP